MTKTLDDIKREAVSVFLVEERPNDTQEDRIRRVTIQDTIDYLQAKGLLMVWQPIETAPKDGTEVVLLNRFGPTSGWYEQGKWRLFRHFNGNAETLIFMYPEPTAWMNLPTAPKEKE